MPKPSCSSPPHLDRHNIAETSAHPYKRGNCSSETRPSMRTGAFSLSISFCKRSASRPPPPMSTCKRGRLARSDAATSISVSKPFRGTNRLTPTINSASSLTPNSRRDDARSSLLSGLNLCVSTPGGITVIGREFPAARRASPAGYSPAAMMWFACLRTRDNTSFDKGNLPGTVTSAPCNTTM